MKYITNKIFQIKPPIWQVTNPAVSYLHAWPKARLLRNKSSQLSEQTALERKAAKFGNWPGLSPDLATDPPMVFIKLLFYDYLGSIRQHCTKERLKIIVNLPILKVFVWWGEVCTSPPPIHYANICKLCPSAEQYHCYSPPVHFKTQDFSLI